MNAPHRLNRKVFATSRLLEFCSRKELELQTGHPAEQWACVVAKELGDNALDACEEAGVAPDISFTVTTARGCGAITVTDNGPGIPPETVAAILDFTVRVSSREAYVSPTRGAQGNALKTLLAMPYVLGNGEDATTSIAACEVHHTITLTVDAVQQKPIAAHERERCNKKNGTTITLYWPDLACSVLREQKQQFLQIVRTFAMLNPHATIRSDWDGEEHVYEAADSNFVKWSPSAATPPCWYDQARFERLLAAYAHEDSARTVREFVSEFRGLSGSAKVCEVLDATRLARVTIGEMFTAEGKPGPRIAPLLRTMQERTNGVKPIDLGVIGKDNFADRFAEIGADLETFEYKRITSRDAELPYIVEAAFVHAPDIGIPRTIITGINFSPAIVNPFRQLGAFGEGLERILAGQRVESNSPVIVAVHFTSPVITYLDRGKSAVALKGEAAEAGLSQASDEAENPEYYLSEIDNLDDGSPAADVITAVKAVTKRWCKQIKAEERDRSAWARRQEALRRTRKETQTDVAREVMERAYMKASANDTLFANARQIMYAARPEIQERTGKQLSDTYFTQTLLPDYIAWANPAWKDKVAYDDRGHFTEPHTGRTIGLGTISVRGYLDDIGEPKLHEAFEAKVQTYGPAGRFVGVFFVEKEGFDALFEQVQIATRYDLAFMSTKGISVTAARELADRMCAKYKIPLYLLTDFDKAGFSGAATFEQDNRRYSYQNEIKVIRLGLRLKDVRALGIEDQAEDVFDRGSEEARRENLRANGATKEEAEFLLHRRVELNALPSDQLVAFVERKLQQRGVRKLVPKTKDLADAYQLFKRATHIGKVVEAEIANFAKEPVPDDLEQRVRAYLAEHPEVPWDAAVRAIVDRES